MDRSRMTNMNTSGFYKLDKILLYGPNYVLNANYKLYCETYDQYQYPVDDWYWFDTEEEARLFFDLPLEPDPDLP
jgi:hypothetical protein